MADIKIPDEYLDEGAALLEKVLEADLAKNSAGLPDICQADPNLRKEALDFIDKVHSNGGTVPTFDC